MTGDQITSCPGCGALTSEDYDDRGTCWECHSGESRPRVTIDTLEEFAALEEDGAGAIVGESGSALIPVGGDVMVYGDGGAGKTTLSVDLSLHLAAGDDWLNMPVSQPFSVLIIENEGPRPFLRAKLRRKLAAWTGSRLDGRLHVLAEPWGEFTFASDEWRDRIAAGVESHEIDVLIAGPLTRLGMDSAGTLQDVIAFMRLVDEVRRLCERPLLVILIHHENKGGAVSGAWEGAGDTLLHVQAAGNGHTVVHVQKARWDSERHGTTLKLKWTDGEGFEVEGDRDYAAEIAALCSDHRWRTAGEIAEAIDARKSTVVKIVQDEQSDRFEMCTGEAARALGRNPSAKLYRVAP